MGEERAVRVSVSDYWAVHAHAPYAPPYAVVGRLKTFIFPGEIQVTELGRSLHRHRSRNSAVELKASLDKIEEMKHNIEGLEAALQDYELRIEHLEAREEHWKEELHHFQDQVRDRDYLMGEAIVQIREVADHLQDLAVQANVLNIKYELVLDRGLELAFLLDRVKTLGPYYGTILTTIVHIQ
ncbi:hypothetical protein PVK06_019347 [Gossypium arboreum]|uniref:Uncharacterized protein n=1 Tax=Gossypium arboreum TaxID=29729 RepID=A0ABR0PJH8_GOSAR|nr:hypothetical protein PVK06_019347 [Gossypium arboreum]